VDIIFSHNLFFLWGLIVCIILRAALDKLGMGHFIDDETQKRITGSSVDFMVIATIMSIQLSILATYLVPLLLVTVAVTLVTALICFGLARYLDDYQFERALTSFGFCCGSTGSGLLLLRILDPNFETPVAKELAFFNVAILVFTFHILFAMAPLLPSFSLVTIVLVYGATIACVLIALFFLGMLRNK
jgi:ESS family glutamate:Na+ symporter